LSLKPLQFGQKLLAIRTGGLSGHGFLRIAYPETPDNAARLIIKPQIDGRYSVRG
jgi:hypothetical protein